MKNLAEFKRALQKALNDGVEIGFEYKSLTTYGVDHPLRERYPEGKEDNRPLVWAKLARVQSNAFSRVTERGESWLYFGAANEWIFSGDKTAICVGGSYEGNGHSYDQRLIYRVP